MLNIVNSNRTEALLASLVDRLQARRFADPFTPWHILVPSIGMRTLLQNQLAASMGICANVEFSFLAQWLWSQVAKLTKVGGRSPLATESLVWRIYAALADDSFVASHARLANWLAQADAAMRYDLAQRIAAVFDKYMTYRTGWMEAWMQGRPVSLGRDVEDPDQAWQLALWQRLARELALPQRHPFQDFGPQLMALDAATLADTGIPDEIHVFALPSIPPMYLEMLAQLAQRIDIHLYIQNPCQEYWFDIVDPKRLGYLATKGKAEHLEVGNRLLAMWGKQTSGFLELLLKAGAPASDEACFMTPDETTLLGCLQAAVLDMRELEPGSVHDLALDGSIEFHCCHTLSRELEVLHDRLLGRFNDDAALTPSNVLVVVPDLEQSAQLIDAVFGTASGTRRIPYRITGRPASTVNPVAAALLELLSIAGSRYYASAVFSLLQKPLVGARFGLAPADLDVILAWLPATRTHWGLDSAQRQRFNAPASERHTFGEGLARLFLGYALPGDAGHPFAGLTAPCNVEGSDSRVLAALDWFLRQLAQLETRLSQDATPADWRETLLGMADNFLQVDAENLADLAATRNAIVALTDNMAAGGEQEFPLAVVRAALTDALDEPTRGGAPTGGVTFSAMSSLRGLPYDLVCLLGMDDGAFPGLNRPVEFDLMKHRKEPGDRDKREEERNLFLDLVLAARQAVYISYTGRSIRDNAALPPSVLVSDLLDYLADATAAKPGSRDSRVAARAALVLEHPLQPFSESYFEEREGGRLFSFHAEYCAALQARRAAAAAAATALATMHAGLPSAQQAGIGSGPAVAAALVPEATAQADEDEESVAEDLPLFFDHSLPPPGEEWRSVSPAQLIEFFKNPCKYLLRHRMRLLLADDAQAIVDDEAFLPDHLAAIGLGQRLLPQLLQGVDPEQARVLAAAGLEFPGGPVGSLLMEDELEALCGFAELLRPRLAEPVLPTVAGSTRIELAGEQWVVEGALADLRAAGLVRYRYAKLSVGDRLAAWISHLFLNTCPAAPSHVTEWHAKDACLRLRPVEDAPALLAELLGLYRRGLCQPLHFFPKASWEYLKKENIEAARRCWLGSEAGQPAFALALRGHPDPIDREFEEASRVVLGTMKNYLDEEER
ncbi:MAG: recC [Paucimonas sp.]|nr:recC [Paucimonas sp.]